MYVAEAKAEDDKGDLLAKYRFVPDLGEAYNGRKKPCIFLLNLSSGAGHAVTSLALREPSSEVTSLCHPVFASEEKVVALSYERSDDGRMLGVIYCPNRPAALWVLALPGNENAERGGVLRCTGQKLTSPGLACRSPRVFTQHSQTFVLFASNAAGGPHHTCSRIEVASLATADTRVLVDSVQDPAPDEFPGVYTPSLPVYLLLQPAGEDAEGFLLVSSVWRCRTAVLLVSLVTGKVVDLAPDTDDHLSWTVLCTDGRSQVVCVRSALNRPPELVLGQIDENGAVAWRVLAKPALSDGRTYLSWASTSPLRIAPSPQCSKSSTTSNSPSSPSQATFPRRPSSCSQRPPSRDPASPSRTAARIPRARLGSRSGRQALRSTAVRPFPGRSRAKPNLTHTQTPSRSPTTPAASALARSTCGRCSARRASWTSRTASRRCAA